MTETELRYRKWRRKRAYARAMRDYIKMAIIVCCIVVAVIAINRAVAKPDVFLDGIYVNGISLGGYSFEDGKALVMELAEERLYQNTITLSYREKAWTFNPSMLNASMDIGTPLSHAWNFGHTGNFFQRKAQRDYLSGRNVAFNSELNYDESLLDQFIAGIKQETDTPSVNATVIVGANEQLKITPSSEGLTLDAETVKDTLQKAIVEGSASSIELAVRVVKPTISYDDLKNGAQRIATCTTSTKASKRERTSNVRRALMKFNGLVVNPGETVSFNGIVGKRTIENGFKEAPEFAGASVTTGIGGGVCQASTTLYNALLRAGMTVESRYQHTMTVSYIRPSLDATVTDRGKDLVFTNNRDSAIYIFTDVDAAHAQVNIFGMPTEYKIELESEIIQDNIKPKGVKKKKDLTGKHAFYTDEMVRISDAKPGVRSRAYLCYYDRQTGELKERDELHTDSYAPSPAIYWVGIHEKDGSVRP